MNDDFQNACFTAEQNGHKLGHIFSNAICFCTKCHAPLTFLATTYISYQNPNYGNAYKYINGLFGSKCNG